MKMKESVLIDKSIKFAARIIKIFVGKGGTSIGANINEANYGNSKADFISKLHIALKEKYDKIKRAKKLNLLRE